MKLNNKGYAITIIVFGILIVFIIVLGSLLITMNNSMKLNKTVKEDVIENIQLGADTSGMSLTERIEALEKKLATVGENSNIVDTIYPVGSIYITTTEMNEETFNAIFPGTKWKSYAQGRTLVGVGTSTDSAGNVATYTKNQTGGSSTVSNVNINHTHSYAHTHTVPAHNHTLSNSGYAKITYGLSTAEIIMERIAVGNWVSHHKYKVTSVSQSDSTAVTWGTGLGGKTDTTAALTTNSQSTSTTGTMSANTAINAQDPYIAVYMYERTE